jgi:lipoprotein NlpI
MELGLEQDAEKDVEQALRRTPDQPLGYQLRASLAMRKKHYPAAEADLNKALSLGGEASSLYLRRGQVRYLAGNFSGALKDFEQAEKATEGGTNRGFMRVWQTLTRARLRQPLQDAKAGISTWPAPLLDVFSGQATPDALIRNLNASPTEEERQLNLCEAYFYLALWADIQNQPERSRDYLKRTVATGVVHFMEYELAQILMK